MNNLVKLNIANFCQLEEVLHDQSKIHSEVSFWGWRRVRVEGKKGSYGFFELLNFVYQRMHGYTYNEEERASGKRLALPIIKIVEDSEESYRIRNVFSKFLCCIFDWWLNYIWYTGVPQGPRDQFVIEGEDIFNAFNHYSREQYTNAFMKEPTGKGRYTYKGVLTWRVAPDLI